MTKSQAPILIVGSDDLAAAIGRTLEDAGCRIERPPSLLPSDLAASSMGAWGGLVLVAPPPLRAPAFLDVDDRQLDTGLDAFLDLFEVLACVTPRLGDGTAILYVGRRGHLGAWGGAHESAFAGAIAGLMRSIALELMPRHIRANVIAADFPDDVSTVQGAKRFEPVCELALFLLTPASAAVSGELILANQGQSLRFREARNQSVRRS